MNFIDRLEKESQDLKEKIVKLNLFIISDKYKQIEKEERDLIKTQVFFMKEYYDILDLRLKIHKR